MTVPLWRPKPPPPLGGAVERKRECKYKENKLGLQDTILQAIITSM